MMEQVVITTEDGYPLTATHFPAADNGARIVLINNAMGVRQQYYHDFAAYLQAQGLAVVTWDYRGVGLSRQGSLRNMHADYLTWADQDQTAMIAWLRDRYPTQPLLVVGHSLGGQIPGLTRHYHELTGILGVASQSGYWKHWQGRGRLRMWALSHVILPGLSRLWGYFPSRLVGMGQDIPANAATTWAQGIRSPRYMLDLYPDIHYFDDLRGPVHLIGFTDDDYAPQAAVEAFGRFFTNATVSHQLISPGDIHQPTIGHFGYFRQSVGASLWPQAAEWLGRA